MSARISVSVSGLNVLIASLDRLDPSKNRAITEPALVEMGLLTVRTAAQRTIKRGGTGDPVAGVLTSRTGTLRRSLTAEARSIDKSQLSRGIVEAGTDIVYGAIHEFGGTVSVKSAQVREHTRTRAFGKRVKAFTVPKHTRKEHEATFPKRPFLAPALDLSIPKFEAIQIKHWDKATR